MDGSFFIRTRASPLGPGAWSFLPPLPSVWRLAAYMIVGAVGLAIGLVLGVIGALASGLIILC